MNRRPWVDLCIAGVVLITLLTATESRAQPSESIFGDPLGTLSISGASDSYVPFIDATPFTEFEFFIISQIDFSDLDRGDLNEESGIIGWEAFATIPAEMTVLSRQILQPGAINVGSQDNWIIGLGAEYFAYESPLALVRYTGLFVLSPAPIDLVVDLAPATPTSFPNAPGPGWVDGQILGDCTAPAGFAIKCLRLFAHVRGMRINCTQGCTVSTESNSWGALKSRF